MNSANIALEIDSVSHGEGGTIVVIIRTSELLGIFDSAQPRPEQIIHACYCHRAVFIALVRIEEFEANVMRTLDVFIISCNSLDAIVFTNICEHSTVISERQSLSGTCCSSSYASGEHLCFHPRPRNTIVFFFLIRPRKFKPRASCVIKCFDRPLVISMRIRMTFERLHAEIEYVFLDMLDPKQGCQVIAS